MAKFDFFCSNYLRNLPCEEALCIFLHKPKANIELLEKIRNGYKCVKGRMLGLASFQETSNMRKDDFLLFSSGSSTSYEQKSNNAEGKLLKNDTNQGNCNGSPEMSLALARSKDKICGICLDVIIEKDPKEQIFGLLQNCVHSYCFDCIFKWIKSTRRTSEHVNAVSCPVCRIKSSIILPSPFWIENEEEKKKLLDDYQNGAFVQDCKYFKEGTQRCPFGNKCAYRHRLANGDIVDVGPPPSPREQRTMLLLYDAIEDEEFVDVNLLHN